MKKEEVRFYRTVAHAAAERSYCVRRHVGAVIFKETSILEYGYNGTPSGDPNVCEGPDGLSLPSVIHAELNAILKMAKKGLSTEDTVLFCTDAPCYNCAIAIHACGIKHVIYERDYRLKDGLNFLVSKNIIVEKYQGENDD